MVPDAICLEKFNTRLRIKYENEILVLETCDRVARLSIITAHQIGLINTFVTKCYLMVSEAIFIVQFNTRLPKKDENYTLLLITLDRVARFSILMPHLIGLFNTIVMRCYLMVPETIFIVKFNTRLQKKYENYNSSTDIFC